MDIDDVLLVMGSAAQALGNIVSRLDERAAHATGDELRAILLRLPTLRADWRDAESDIQSIDEERDTFPMPSVAVIAALTGATEGLAVRIARDSSTDALLSLATSLTSALATVRPQA